MIALFLILLLVALALAAIDHFAFPLPRIVWAIFAVFVIVVLFILLLGALPDAELNHR